MFTQAEMPLERMQTAVKRGFTCGDCGQLLTIAWGGKWGINKDVLLCPGHPEHKTIAREAALSTWDTPDEYNPFSYTLDRKRRKKMEKTLGIEKARSLAPLAGRGNLTQSQAMQIMETVWPGAPTVEKTKAAMICAQYGLNPLMKHLYLIPFAGKSGQVWAVVMGIKASRIIARRRGDYAYLDDTPRRMNEAEQERILGEVDKANIWAITKLRDTHGNTAQGVGSWPAAVAAYGTDKGNSKINMAIIRSERNALDRLFPDSLPQEVETRDERYDPPIRIVDLGAGEIVDGGRTPELAEPPVDQGDAPPEDGDTPVEPPPGKRKPEVQAALDKVSAADIPDLNSLLKLANRVLGMQPTAVLKELGYTRQGDITESPWACWQKLIAW